MFFPLYKLCVILIANEATYAFVYEVRTYSQLLSAGMFVITLMSAARLVRRKFTLKLEIVVFAKFFCIYFVRTSSLIHSAFCFE